MADQKLELDCKERVAFDLMQRIYSPEGSADADAFQKPNARTYYLTLFYQFMKAARAVAALRTEEPTGVATAARSARRAPSTQPNVRASGSENKSRLQESPCRTGYDLMCSRALPS